MKFKPSAIVLLALLCGSSGCSRWEFSCRRTHWDGELADISHAAMQQSMMVDPRLANSDFAAGWRAGYENILRGGSGEVPIVPPSDYFDPELRRPSQSHRASAWFEGFAAGADAAGESGVHGYAELPSTDPRPEVVLQHPFYTAELPTGTPHEMAAGSLSLPTPLPPVERKTETTETSKGPSSTGDVKLPDVTDGGVTDEVRSKESSQPSRESTPTPESKEDAATSPSDAPAELLPPPNPSDDLLDQSAHGGNEPSSPQSVHDSFVRLDQAAHAMRQSGWVLPAAPGRSARVADLSPEPLVPLHSEPRR